MTQRWAISNLLLKQNKISFDQVKEVQRNSLEKSLTEQESIIDLGFVTEDDLVELFATIYGYEIVNIEQEHFNMDCIASISQDACLKLVSIPVKYSEDKKTIIIVINDPTNITALEAIKLHFTGYSIDFKLAPRTKIINVIHLIYSKQSSEVATKELQENTDTRNVGNTGFHALETERDEPIIKLTNSILTESIIAKASDIHIEPFEKYMAVRIRVDGRLRDALRLPIQNFQGICTRFKLISQMDISEKRIPQEGSIKMRYNSKNIDIRVSTLPNTYGEKIVMRILSKDNLNIPKEKLGFTKDNLDAIKNMLDNPHGIILVTGPTGSGKSTTLYSFLSDVKSTEKAIVTVEDPVEYTIDGINQTPVNVKQGMTFPVALRSILRQDPDIIMIGEIRDEETAAIAIRASITGHLVMSTLHTNDSISTISRLTDMNIEPYLLADSLRGVIAQRLLRRVCPHCKEEYLSSISEMRMLKLGAPVPLVQAVGCSHCNHTGYLGRVGVYEVLSVDRQLRVLIEKGASHEELLNHATNNGNMKSLSSVAIEKVLAHDTTVEELQEVMYDIR